jgi:hypothetical protein
MQTDILIKDLLAKENFQQCYRKFFSKSVFYLDKSGFKIGQKTQNLTGNFGFCREKNS